MSSRPRNLEVVSPRLTDFLIDSLCVWGSEERWADTLRELDADGWTGVMFILGQATQLEVLRALGERLARLGLLAPASSN